MDGRILHLTRRQLRLLHDNLAAQGASHDDLPKVDRVLDKLWTECTATPDDTPTRVVLLHDEFAWVSERWRGNNSFSLEPTLRKMILKVSDAISTAPGFALKATDTSVTVERERDTDRRNAENPGAST